MRLLLGTGFLLLSGLSFADREITVPKGKKIRDGVFRAEVLGVPGDRTTRAWFGAGFLQAYDFELTAVRTKREDWKSSFDFSYNFAPPITDISPGISFGVQDAVNVTDEGRALYLATTFRYGNTGDLNQDIPTELTLGLWSRKTGLFFMGVSLPFSEKVLLVAEHDSQRIAGGFELRPFHGMVVKTVFESDGTSFGLALHRRF